VDDLVIDNPENTLTMVAIVLLTLLLYEEIPIGTFIQKNESRRKRSESCDGTSGSNDGEACSG